MKPVNSIEIIEAAGHDVRRAMFAIEGERQCLERVLAEDQALIEELVEALEALESLTRAIAEQRVLPSALRIAPEVVAARAAIAKAKGVKA